MQEKARAQFGTNFLGKKHFENSECASAKV